MLNLNNYSSNSNNNVGGFDSDPILKCPAARLEQRDTESSVSKIYRGGCQSTAGMNIRHGLEIPKTSKRYGQLYDTAFSIENLHHAYIEARRGKRTKVGTYLFEKNIGSNLHDLHEELISGTYRPKSYRSFVVHTPKPRVIHAPDFRDLVVQHAIYRVIYNIFNAGFIDTSYACRKNGGTHRASLYTQREMRRYSGDMYYAHLDVRKFFYSIDRDVLKKLFEKKIKDKRFVEIMCRFAEMPEPNGIPIGNLLSQLYALIYLNPLDHFIKRELKITSYVRYVDDFVMIGLTRDEAMEAKARCEAFLMDNLGLSLSHWTIQPIRKGINFVGYRTWRGARFVRKHSLYTFKKSAVSGRVESIVSLIGHAKGTGSLHYFGRMLAAHMPDYKNKLPQRSLQCLHMSNSHL